METIYIETTVVSYLVAESKPWIPFWPRTSNLPRQWWQNERQRYHCVTSREVLREGESG